MKYAIIANGKVVNIAEAGPGFEPPDNWVASETASIGQLYDGIAFSDPVVVKTKDELKDDIAQRRYQEETKGITVNGAQVDTDRQSQALITGAAVAAMDDANITSKWKARNGFVTLDAASILSVARAVRAHVQACFDREAELVEAVDGGTFTKDMLDQGWP